MKTKIKVRKETQQLQLLIRLFDYTENDPQTMVNKTPNMHSNCFTGFKYEQNMSTTFNQAVGQNQPK